MTVYVQIFMVYTIHISAQHSGMLTCSLQYRSRIKKKEKLENNRTNNKTPETQRCKPQSGNSGASKGIETKVVNELNIHIKQQNTNTRTQYTHYFALRTPIHTYKTTTSASQKATLHQHCKTKRPIITNHPYITTTLAQ